MMIYLYIALLLLIISFGYIKIAEKYNIIDKPNHRSSHTKTTIRGGGILFVVALLLFYVTSGFQYSYFVFGTTLIAIVSFVDDIKTLSSKVRLPFQFIAVFSVFYQVDILVFPIYLIPVIIVLGVGFINIYNFMDGINGITGLYSIVVLSGFYFINTEVHAVDADLIIYSLVSLAVFGYYNFRKKARFFAGDIGSISIAMIISFIGVSLVVATSSPLIFFAVALYGGDALFTLVYRIRIKEKLSEAHRHHLYQKLVHLGGFSHLKVAFFYAIAQLLLFVIIYYSYQLDAYIQYGIGILIMVVFSLLYLYLFQYLDSIAKKIDA